MKFIFSIFLTSILLLNSFSTVLLYATFKMQQDEIAKTLCVLRAQKNNSCNGNCVLRAELKKQTEREQKHTTVLKEKAEISYTISKIKYILNPIVSTEINKPIFFYNSAKPNSISLAVFHPPTT